MSPEFEIAGDEIPYVAGAGHPAGSIPPGTLEHLREYTSHFACIYKSGLSFGFDREPKRRVLLGNSPIFAMRRYAIPKAPVDDTLRSARARQSDLRDHESLETAALSSLS